MRSGNRFATFGAVLFVAALLSPWGLGNGKTSAQQPAEPGGTKVNVYIGTYTGPNSQGIYRARLDMKTGALSSPQLAGKTDNPSFLAFHPNGKFLYAVNEQGNGGVSSFAVDPATGDLTAINQQPSHGSYPAHLSIDPSGKCLLVANYGNGTFASYPLAANGSIGPAASVIQDSGKGPNQERQEGPHAHGIWPWAGRDFAFGCDLGNDKIDIFHLDSEKATLERRFTHPFALPPGTGPRHLVFSQTGDTMYVIAELNNTISAVTFPINAPGINPLVFQTISTLPKGFTGSNKAAELHLSPDEKFLYATNRGLDDLVTYSIAPRTDKRTGQLTEIARTPTAGKGPRDFDLDPTGKWLIVANQDSNNITTFAIDPVTGIPRLVGDPVPLASPVCILFQAR
jgi:6-phosphogluconolactonase